MHYSGVFLLCVWVPLWLAWLIWGTILRFNDEGTTLAKFNDSVGLFMMIYILVTWVISVLSCIGCLYMGSKKYAEQKAAALGDLKF